MTIQQHLIKVLKIAGWVLLICALTVITVVFWAFIGVLIAVLIPLLIIGAVIKAAIRDHQGKRYDYPYVPGPVRMSHIPRKPERIMHNVTLDVVPDDSDG